MEWIPSHAALATHPKVKRLGRLLEISVPAAIGHLHLLWWFAADYTTDGDLSRFDLADLADAVYWSGDIDTFIQALIDCGPGDSSGFLERVDGHLMIHDFEEHIGCRLKQVKASRERAKAHREKTKDDGTRTERVAYAYATHSERIRKRERERERIGTHSTIENECLDAFECIPEYPFDETKDTKLVGELAKLYPDIDVAFEIGNWATWMDDNPGRVKNYRSSFRQWCGRAKPKPKDGQSDVMFDTTPAESWFEL